MNPNSNLATKATGKKNGVENKPVLNVVETKKANEEKPLVNESSNKIVSLPTIQELKDRATLMIILRDKHDELTQKKKALQEFSLSHDKNNAQIEVVDAKGREFSSSSPKSIKKLIEFWQEEFAEAIKEIEKQLIEAATNGAS